MAYFAFACSIAMACAGPAAGGPRGGEHDVGDHQGDGEGHDAGGNHDEGGNSGPHKGPAGDPVGDNSSLPSNDPPPSDGGISTATTVDPPAGGGHSLDLPLALQPPEDSTVPPAVHPIEVLPGVPDKVVRACHDAVVQAAASFGATSVRVSSAGSMHQLGSHTISAPIQVSIDYVHDGRVETRQAPIGCELNAKGSVIGLT
ncbi:hypothetical protein [Mesorhizobium sp. WSM4884]|uniref:hypothetical protein n=1 Tax=Mesorhizobium sp. WSM4884 TaxID=3038542 RepID=UPI002416BA3F|nr:hypothetical protein [Mesorhizobium sp. WSM4884]MDG4880213.1 hypothetical protein [Mesorhizobium sp. WSM4884]